MKRPILLMIVAAFLLAAVCSCRHQCTVRVDGGWIEGTRDGILSVYKGIPFAAPPVGELRWKEPQPVEGWKGVLQTKEFAPSPMQANADLDNISEDCLYLNVWTPARTSADKLPVMVWIYGGGFSIGSTSYPYCDGAELARTGVVVASIAYRLGYLGFLVHPELSADSSEGVSGNYGLLDQIAGLRWVKDNIEAFGGDPDNITVFGQSAGAISISMLCASPLAEGLFQRAISQSGGSFSPCRETAYPGGNMKTMEMAAADGKAYMESLKVNSLEEMRALPDSIFARPYDATGGPGPVIDGYVLPDDQYNLYKAGRYNDVDLLIGYNSDEGEAFTDKDSTRHIRNMYERFGEYAPALLDAYPVTSNPVPKSGRDLLRDASFGWHTWTWARLKAETGKARIFLYYFDRHNAAPGSDLGAVHGSEVEYVFQHQTGEHPGDMDFGRMIGGYWTNFAATGDPNGEGLPQWPEFTGGNQQAMYLTDEDSHAGEVPDKESMTLLDAFFASRRNQ